MSQEESKESIATVSSFGFARNYLTVIFLIICLIVLSVFWGFGYKADTLIKGQLHHQAQAFFQEVVLTREWAARHGGVYVKLRPGIEINPYLLKVPGLKVVITDGDGEKYILKNPALITREISDLAAQKGIHKFRIKSLEPLNPSNYPDEFERVALLSFQKGNKEYATFESDGKETFYRYMAPLLTELSCLRCHADQGYRAGDIRGGISVTITATHMMQQLKENRIFLLLSALGILALIFAIIKLISQVFIKRLRTAEKKLVELASRDFLTGLLNRRELFNQLEAETSRTDRLGKPLSVILLDIDHFKQINDTYGHSLGDTVLKELSRNLLVSVRDYDIVSRYGGEEFLIVTPETSADSALELAERLRVVASNMAIPFGLEGAEVTVTISAGVTQRKSGEEVHKTISRADVALYRAKEAGRNRVELG